MTQGRDGLSWLLLGTGVVAIVFGLTATGSGGETISTSAAPARPAAVASKVTSKVTAKPSATTATTVAANRCTNAELGYSLAYPRDWHVGAGPSGPCRFFASYPVVDDGTRNFPKAEISVFTDYGNLEDARAVFDGGDVRTTASQTLTINGVKVVMADFTYPDDPAADGRLYAFDRPGTDAVVILARKENTTDYEATRAALDALVRTVVLSH